MPVRKTIPEKDGVYFITFTCAGWLSLFAITKNYNAVYTWFDVLKSRASYNWLYNNAQPCTRNYCVHNTGKSINSIIGNGKRFMAYDLVSQLEKQQCDNILKQPERQVNNTKSR